MPFGEPLAWNPKALGELGVTGSFQAAAGVKVTEPVLAEAIAFQTPVMVAPVGRLTVTRQPLMLVVEVILIWATKPVPQELIAGSKVAVQPLPPFPVVVVVVVVVVGGWVVVVVVVGG